MWKINIAALLAACWAGAAWAAGEGTVGSPSADGGVRPSLLVVLSTATAKDNAWRSVAEGLRAKHSDMQAEVLVCNGPVADCLGELRTRLPRYVAFVMKPDEARFETVLGLRRLMREVDDDPFDDAIWGIVSAPSARDALRIAKSNEPKRLVDALTTTGIDESLYPGKGVTMLDTNPPGRWQIKEANGTVSVHTGKGSLAKAFADAWNRLDPQVLVTSAHASQRKMTMPFNCGHILPKDGRFVGDGGESFKRPRREKVWIAAGNCEIADNPPGDNMVMTALGFGKVNQFVGYTVTTWFGDVGWNTLHYAGGCRLPLNEAYYFANQYLIRRVADRIGEKAKTFKPRFATARDCTVDRFKAEVVRAGLPSGRNLLGLLWDRDGTVFWGDPAQRIGFDPAGASTKAGDGKGLPLGIVFAGTKPGRRLKRAPEGFEVFVADDFALVTKWPDLKPGWQKELVFE